MTIYSLIFVGNYVAYFFIIIKNYKEVCKFHTYLPLGVTVTGTQSPYAEVAQQNFACSSMPIYFSASFYLHKFQGDEITGGEIKKQKNLNHIKSKIE